VAICIVLPKSKKSRKLLKGNHTLPSLGHPMKYSYVQS
jgi:hypothetical protein